MALDDYGGDKWWVNNIREVYQAVVWGYIGLGEVHVLPFSVPMQYVTQDPFQQVNASFTSFSFVTLCFYLHRFLIQIRQDTS